MSSQFFKLSYPPSNPHGYCKVDHLQGIDDLWAVGQGASLRENPPGRITMAMHEDEPTNTVLPDNVRNTDSLLIVSPRVRAFLQQRAVGHIEFLPLDILDHKGNVASGEYSIAHLTDHVDCIDVAASGVTWANQGLATQRILDLNELTIDSSRVPQDRELFFPRYFAETPIVRAELAEALKAAGFTNMKFRAVASSGE
ncbi:MAG: hypothetical protein JSU08_00190 [Acidobacteria bacterium]|nr:hypothetical protein [Acidobacteriota bacterium]